MKLTWVLLPVQGVYSLNTYPKYKLRRRRQLAELRKQLDEAQLMKPILVGEQRAAFSNTVQAAEGLRYETTGSGKKADPVAVAPKARSAKKAEEQPATAGGTLGYLYHCPPHNTC